MATVFRGGRALFNMLPGNAPQQLPIPGLAKLPKVVPGVPTPRAPVGRRSAPFEELPEDIARRGRTGKLSLDEALEEYRLENPDYRPRKIHDAPYVTFDPVTGQEVRPTWNLLAPSSGQTEMLLQASELGDLDIALGIVLNSIKTAETPNQLYASLLQMRALRNTFGARQAAGAPSRITRSGASDTAAYGGMSRTEDLSQVGLAGELSPTDNAIIDTEVWRAAYRVGIPESELGNWPDAFKSLGIEGMARGEKTELMRIRDMITKIRTRKADNPDKLRQNIAELDELVAPNGPIARNTLSPRDTEIAIEQYNYARGVLSKKLGTPDSRGLKSLEKHLGKGLLEDKLHLLFRSAINSADNMEEIQAISALARVNFKSITFLDDIEGEALERIGSMLAARFKAARDAAPDRFASPQARPARGAPQTNEEFARDFALQNERYRNRPRNPYGDDFGAALPYAMSKEAGMQRDWKNFGRGHIPFGPGRNFRSFEAYDPESGEFVHRLMRWNQEAKKWEEIDTINAVRGPRSSYRTPPVDGRTGKFVRGEGEFVEFQGFTQRVQTPLPKQAVELSTPDLVMETIRGLGIRYDLPREQVQKAAKSAANLVKKLESDGVIAAGTAQYTWVTGVFPRIALQVSGPGYNVTKVRGLVSHDANFTRRQAALVAFNNAESAGLVPAEIAGYIRKMNPGTETYEQLLEQARQAFATRRAAGSTTQQVRRAQRVIEESEESSVAAERAAIQRIMKESEAASERLAKKATS